MPRLKSLIQSVRPHIWPLALILITTAVVFLPVLKCDLIDFDDPSYINTNPWVTRPISWRSIEALWNQCILQLWHPLTSITLHLIYQFSGVKPWGFHLVSLIFHLASSALVYVLFIQLTGLRWRSASVAILFAIHPLRVESVAWASEIKDVGSVLFGLLCMVSYVVWAKRRSWTGLGMATVFLCMSMLYKPMLIMMPVMLLLLDFWPLGRVGVRGRYLEKIPLVLVVTVICLMIQARSHDGPSQGLGIKQYPLWLRLSNVPISYVRYIGKMIWFDGLSYHYKMPAAWPIWQIAGSTILLISITVATWFLRREKPMLWVGWWWFILAILPVCGILQVSDYSMADRYTYFSSIGLLAMLIFALPDTLFMTTAARRIAAGGMLVTVLVLGVSTWHQISHWRNGMALFVWGYEVDPTDPLSHVGIGGASILANHYDLAHKHLNEAIRLDPECVPAHYKLSILHQIEGRLDDSYREAKIVSELVPGLPTGWNQLGCVHLAKGEFASAAAMFERALKTQPDSPNLLFELGMSYVASGNDDKAIPVFQKAIEFSIDSAPGIHWNLGVSLARRNRADEAIAEFRIAVRENPDHLPTRLDLGVALVRNGQWQEGLTQLQWVLVHRPDEFNALLYSGIAMGHLNRMDDAMTNLKSAAARRPESAAVHDAMADVLGGLGRYEEAIHELDVADRLDPKNPKRNAIRGIFMTRVRSSP